VVIGVGIDVVAIERFAATLERTPRLRERLFAADERELPAASLAARFAVKEAVAKALGAPVGLHWVDVEVRRSLSGQPVLEVHGTVAALADELGVRRWHVSMSHDAGIASAVVVAEGDG
jgi:holo-[acyl-carrier protein] synthase